MVFRTHGGQVWRSMLAASAGRADIADDATAEAFARLLSHRERVREPVPWVYRTAFRLTTEELRRGRRTSGHVGEHGADDPSSLPGELTEALAQLSPDQRLAVFLHYYADLPVAEVGRLLGTPAATVKVRLHPARRALRTSLEPVGGEDG